MQRAHRAIYAGSFDPLTYGHLNVIERGSLLVDELIVAIAVNTAKQGVFDIEERKELIHSSLTGLDNVRVDAFQGLLVNYAREVGARVLLRGLRSVKDFEFEFQMALTNKELSGDIETVFLATEGQYAHLASSLIREIVSMGGSVTGMVPPHVETALQDKLAPDGA